MTSPTSLFSPVSTVAPNLASTIIPDHDQIGGCRLLHLLGKGGMGEVFAAEHLALQKTVAVKLLPRDKVDPGSVERFFREARACAQIEHPNVVTIHDVGEQYGCYYIVLQYVQGQNLSEVVQTHGGPLPWKTAFKIIRQVARGLDAVHKAGLIHRDIKPANIMVSSNSRVFLMDFGLVREEQSSELSRPGSVLGTPAYMSPEQCDGKELDARSDLYSLGGTLYYLLTGQLPFNARTIHSMMAKISSGESPTPVNVLNCMVPADAQAVVERAMSFRLSDRFQTASAFDKAMSPVLRASRSESGQTRLDTAPIVASQTLNEEQGFVDPKLAPLELIPDVSILDPEPEPEPDWKRWVLISGVAVGILTLGLSLRAIFSPDASPEPSPEQIEESAPIEIAGMVRIPSGKTNLGDDFKIIRQHMDSVGVTNEIKNWPPPTTVDVKEFYIDRYEVTNAEYARFIQSSGHPYPEYWDGTTPPDGTAKQPVTQVTFADAQTYARWAKKKLPTTAQWIRAARGESSQLYPWGNEWQDHLTNSTENKTFSSDNPSDVDATPLDVSEFGVFNLAGNVAEFIRDPSGTASHPVLLYGSDYLTIGKYFSVPTAFRKIVATVKDKVAGFRCVVEVDDLHHHTQQPPTR